MKYVLTTSWLTFMLALASCNGGPNAEEVLTRSYDAMREVQSYRFSGEIETETPDGVIGGRQTGEWAAPGQWYLRLEPSGEFAGQMTETVVVNQRLFTRELGAQGGEWRESPFNLEKSNVYNPLPESYLAIRDLENLRCLDDIVVNGTQTFQISGDQKETQTLPERYPPQPNGNEVVWVTTHTWFIAREDYLLVRSVIEQTAGQSGATHRNTWDFYDYSQSVTIEMPELN